MRALVRGVIYTIVHEEDGELWLENDDERIVVPADARYVTRMSASVERRVMTAMRRDARRLPTDRDE